jgi:hypothetical protein
MLRTLSFHMAKNVGVQLFEEILGEITALEREVSRSLLHQGKPSESLNGTTGKQQSQETRSMVGRSLDHRRADRVHCSLPPGIIPSKS